MSHIADRHSMGFPPLRHNEAAVEIGTRNVVYGLAIKDGNADLSGISEEQSVGDLNGAALWRASDKGKRPHPGWSFAWAAQVALPERQRGGSGGAGGSGGGAGGSGKPTVDSHGLTPYGAKPSATPAAGFASFRNADGSDPFKFFGAHTGPLGLIRQEDFGLFGVQPKGTQLGLIKQEGFGIFGAQPKGTALSGIQVNGAGGAVPGTGESNPVASAGTTVSGKPVTDNASDADPTAGAGALPTGSGQSNGAGGAGGAGGSSSVGGGGGGIAGAPASVLPTFDANHRLDDRYGLKPANEPPWASKRPRGWPGVVMAGSNEDVQEDVFIPAGSALVSANAPEADPTLSTAVVDVTKEGAVDTERRVPLGDAWRVVHDPLGLGKNSLSWVLTPTAKYAPWFGGMVTDIDRKAAGTVARGAPVPVVHGLASSRTALSIGGAPASGPLDVGDSDDKHSLGQDADGNGINPVHISTDALYLMRDPSGNFRDGPLDFEKAPYPLNLQRGPSKMPVHLVFDRSAGSWRMWSESQLDDDEDTPPPPPPPTTPPPVTTPPPSTTPPPPTTPSTTPPPVTTPPPPPTTGDWFKKWQFPVDPWGHEIPRDPPGPTANMLSGGVGVSGPTDPRFQRPAAYVGPTVQTEPRPLLQTHRELAVPALVIKPHSMGCGTRDLRNDPIGDPEAMRKHREEDPVVMRIEGAWSKIGADCNPGSPSYTNRPGNARYLGGTANGVTALLPPEVGLEDAATNFAPPGMSVSTAYVVALKGKVSFGSGYPDPTGGTCKSGNIWGTNASTTALEIKSTTSAGVLNNTRSLPDRAGSIVLAPSALTPDVLPKPDANGDLVDGPIKDDSANSALGTTRTLLRLGTLAASASFPALKRSGGLLEVRYADDSGYTGSAASNFSINAALPQLDGVGVILAHDDQIDWNTDADDQAGTRLSRVANGKVVLSDPTGGNTTPLLAFNIADTDNGALRGGPRSVSVMRGDETEYATLIARELVSRPTTGSTNAVTLIAPTATGARVQNLQDASGTVALTADLAAYQPLDSDLTSLAALGTASDKMAYTTAAHTWAETALTSAGRAIIDDATASDQRTTLGLGTIATQAASAVAITGGTIDGAVIGDLEVGTTSQTASNGGNYAVAAAIAQVFVDASGLSGTNNYDVTLPSAATYAKRLVRVKVKVVGTGSATVTVKSSSGTVEGAAAATGVPLDATSRSKVSYQSDGTSWWSV